MYSIGIPIFNRTVYLRDVLYRCIHQTYQGSYEIVIADSSDHDRVKAIVDSFNCSKIRYLRYPSSIQLTAKLNALVEQCQGDSMLILCDDDLLDVDYLKKMAENIADFPDATLFRCRYKLIDKDGKLLRLDQLCQRHMTPAEFMRSVFLKEKEFFKMNISGIIFPRKLFKELGSFKDLPVPWHTERIAWTMLAAQGGCVFEEQSLCSIRLHSGSITSTFNPDLTSSIESDLISRKVFNEIISEVEQKMELSGENKRLIAEARLNLDLYMERHMARSLDHGFISFLSDNQQKAFQRMITLFSKMKEFGIPPFASAKMYFCLSLLPFMLRQPILNALKHYKIRKWCV
jgi:glycosyltransferase involved in cell wall biosynthesis